MGDFYHPLSLSLSLLPRIPDVRAQYDVNVTVRQHLYRIISCAAGTHPLLTTCFLLSPIWLPTLIPLSHLDPLTHASLVFLSNPLQLVKIVLTVTNPTSPSTHTHTHTHTQFELYFGLLLFCGFVLFDTQLIVEKFNHGNDDFIWHSLDLFLDFVNIFRRLLVILASKVRVGFVCVVCVFVFVLFVCVCVVCVFVFVLFVYWFTCQLSLRCFIGKHYHIWYL